MRRDPSKDDTQDYEYSYQAGISLYEEVHGGGEVAIYARGKNIVAKSVCVILCIHPLDVVVTD